MPKHYQRKAGYKLSSKNSEVKPRKRVAIVLSLLTLVLTVTGVLACSARGDQPVTTVILVRHAEKVIDPANKDPDLSPMGQARAAELARMFGDAGIKAIYATQYKRTQQTVKPLADKLGLATTVVDAKDTAAVVKQISAQHNGETIFVAGHNNSVPEIIAALGGPKLPIIPETDYDNLFVLTIYRTGKAKLLQMKYGSAAAAPAASPNNAVSPAPMTQSYRKPNYHHNEEASEERKPS